jgi:hypothetical protein
MQKIINKKGKKGKKIQNLTKNKSAKENSDK